VQRVSFRHVRSKIRVPGFICHHLIPHQVSDAQVFGIFFGMMKSLGFSVDDFCTNGMHLPCDEKTAFMIGRPIHRGGHPLYNKLVAEQIAQIQSLQPFEAHAALTALISSLRSALSISSLGELNLIENTDELALERDLETIGILGAARMKMPRLP
jgi:A nuclease family of the HNH/ENDO VII superfamily with conserved AHH